MPICEAISSVRSFSVRSSRRAVPSSMPAPSRRLNLSDSLTPCSLSMALPMSESSVMRSLPFPVSSAAATPRRLSSMRIGASPVSLSCVICWFRFCMVPRKPSSVPPLAFTAPPHLLRLFALTPSVLLERSSVAPMATVFLTNPMMLPAPVTAAKKSNADWRSLRQPSSARFWRAASSLEAALAASFVFFKD